MFAVRLPDDAGDVAFRAAARRCIALGLPPAQIAFLGADEPSLWPPLPEPSGAPAPIAAPRAYGELLRDALIHSAPDRHALAYEVLWRILAGERGLVSRAVDPTVARLNDYARNVRRDIHKMHAFVRFRACMVGERTIFTAWFEPQHHILQRVSTFFVDRFAGMDWLIATPRGTLSWIDRALAFGPPPAVKPDAADDAVLDELWLTYFRTTFNPARLRVKAMVNEMPRRYWKNLPEAALIPALTTGAAPRVAAMAAAPDDEAPAFAARIAARRKKDSTP